MMNSNTEINNSGRKANALSKETSPYLLQHAYNPVDWRPWGDEAFSEARDRDVPILLSVGYSACHWCHVMEHESFENEEIAAQMNRDFVCIKVDREERPDVDGIYMSAVQMMTGQGGWPMTMFLTLEGKPFFGGTYFPPDDKYGRPGFPRILTAVADAWRTKRGEIEEQGQEITGGLIESDQKMNGLEETLLTSKILDSAYTKLASQFDRQYGGFGSAPKFPQPMNLDFLLRTHARTKRTEPLAMAERTLQKMAVGGIYDQLGGGFHRYSVDQTWLVPHFEKMLYDNAQLAQIYCRAYQATGKSFYKGIAEETLEYILREMTSPEGGFFSAQDADSEGVEGKFFVWTPEEITAILGNYNSAVFCAFYDVTPGGNWGEGEGSSILHVVKDVADVAKQFNLTLKDAAEILDGGRTKLFAEREKRVKPGLDDKILASWNGLAMAAFAECGIVFERQDFIDAAKKNAEFIMNSMSEVDTAQHLNRLKRTYRNGEAKLNAYLEDYSFVIDGLLWVYEADGHERYFYEASVLTATMNALFNDENGVGFFATSSDHESLIHRPKDWDDNAIPSGNSVALEVLLKWDAINGDRKHSSFAMKLLRKIGSMLENHPYSFARMLGVLDFYLAEVKEIAIIGAPEDPATQALKRTLYGSYRPNKVVSVADRPIGADPARALLANRELLEGKPTVYVCQNFTCQRPVNTPEELGEQLK